MERIAAEIRRLTAAVEHAAGVMEELVALLGDDSIEEHLRELDQETRKLVRK